MCQHCATCYDSTVIKHYPPNVVIKDSCFIGLYFLLQLRRLNELEDMVADQDNSIAVVTEKLSKARNEIQDWKFKYDELIKSTAAEKEK